MERVYCQECGAVAAVQEEGPPPSCSACGAPLTSPATMGAAQVDDETLAADLRDAFGLGVTDYGIGKSTAVRTAASSAAWVRGFATSAGLAPRSRLAGFEIIGEIGRGGMGVVYRARQLALDREVALKVLPYISGAGTRMSRRFQTEAKAAARLNHSNVVPVYAQGEEGGRLYYAMKLVEGESLDAVIKSHPELLSSTHAAGGAPIPSRTASTEEETPSVGETEAAPEQVKRSVPHPRSRDDFAYIARLMAEVADGLEHAHANGVLHRDIKPHNLIFGNDRHLYITDFGLAYIQGDPHLTVDGEVMGTPSYLSPEQARGAVGDIDARTDIFSFGVTLYEMTSGLRPFQGETRDQILHAVCEVIPQRPRAVDPRIPIDLETICLRAMEKAPADRYQRASDVAEDLRRFSDRRPILARRSTVVRKAAKWIRRHPAWSTAAVAVVALIGMTIGWGAFVASTHRLHARQHVDAAFHQLVHLSFRKPELAAPDIERARELGADGSEFMIVQSLLDIAEFDQESAVERLARLIAAEPDNVGALYILGWAQRRIRQIEVARETRRLADEIGGPRTSEDFFFRALAAQRTDPAIAIESYRMAIRLSAKSNQYFPQASLHLARAHNQQMYRERTLEFFDEAARSLEQVIRQEQYGGYPYYLLSITHRLAGEIHEAGFEPGGTEAALEEFAAALDVAQQGQLAAPDDDLPVTAEASALERLDRLEEALDARNRALALAKEDERRYEAFHYRSRLEFWLGLHLDAIKDIERMQEWAPDDRLYGHVYPAIVYADMGDMDAALEALNVLIVNHAGDADAVMMAATGLRLLGREPAAAALLEENRETVVFSDTADNERPEGWQESLFGFLAGELSLDRLAEIASVGASARRIMGEAHYHAGAKALGAGNKTRAKDHFRRAYHAFDGSMRYTFHAEVLLRKLENDDSWPPWVASVGDVQSSTEPALRTHTATARLE